MARKEEPIILIDQTIGDEPYQVKLYADFAYLSEDIQDYMAKLRSARGLPQNTDAVMPDEGLIDAVLGQLKDMPEGNARQRIRKNERIQKEILDYYTKHLGSLENDATMLAITMEADLHVTPEPYKDGAKGRKRPGLIELPAPVKDISDPTGVEYRLKQLLDQLVAGNAFGTFMHHIQLMGVDSRRRLVERDPDGFHPSGANPIVLDGAFTNSLSEGGGSTDASDS